MECIKKQAGLELARRNRHKVRENLCFGYLTNLNLLSFTNSENQRYPLLCVCCEDFNKENKPDISILVSFDKP